MNRSPGTLLAYACLICALLWAGFIWYLSDQPSIEVPSLFPQQDKLMHICAYFVLGFLAMGAMRPSVYGYTANQLGVVIVLTGLYGLLDEFHQYFVPGRDASLADSLADFAGGVLGAGLLFLLVRRFMRRSGNATIH